MAGKGLLCHLNRSAAGSRGETHFFTTNVSISEAPLILAFVHVILAGELDWVKIETNAGVAMHLLQGVPLHYLDPRAFQRLVAYSPRYRT